MLLSKTYPSAFGTKVFSTASFNFENRAKSNSQKPAMNVENEKQNLNVNLKNDNNKPGAYLSLERIIEILNKFLNEKGMPKEKLARLLEISQEELDSFLNKQASILLIQKVNLPLIKLVCETKFNSTNNQQ